MPGGKTGKWNHCKNARAIQKMTRMVRNRTVYMSIVFTFQACLYSLLLKLSAILPQSPWQVYSRRMIVYSMGSILGT